MLRFFCFISLVISLLSVSTTHAFIMASDPLVLNPHIATDVFVAGLGDEQENQFLKAALLAAKVAKDRFPQRQRVLISPVNSSLRNEAKLIRLNGFELQQAHSDELTKAQFINALSKIKAPIFSLQFFGHANTYNGFRLQSMTKRLSHLEPEFEQIGKYLATQAIVVFHSCNSGWLLAPAAAQLWKRPVFGSFEAADFQELMNDKQWYYHDIGRYPENLQRIGSTSIITQQTIDCAVGNCLRLKPVNFPYVDKFGKFKRGLGFYKPFSAFKDALPLALIHFTLLTPTTTPLTIHSPRADFMHAVADWMCPDPGVDAKNNLTCQTSIQSLEFLQNPHLNFYHGLAVACDNMKCSTTVKCQPWKAVLGLVPCKTLEIEDKKSTVFSDQLKQFKAGLDQFERGLVTF